MPPSKLSSAYLGTYNTLSALFRISLFVRTVQIWVNGGHAAVWNELNVTARWAETFTVIEIIHALIGLVPSAPATTALQVAGRNTIVWAITRNYPEIAARNPAYAYMLAAWNAADAIRYTYFALLKVAGYVPEFLLWLRYNMFIILYPIGVLSEASLVYAVIGPSRARNPLYEYLLWFGLVIYLPAFYVLFGHMLAQRSKTRKVSRKNL